MEGAVAIDPRQVGRNVVMTAAIAGLGGLLLGYDTGVIAGALLFITPDFGLSSFESGMVVGAVPIGAVVGAAFAGRLCDAYGRRLLIIISSIVFFNFLVSLTFLLLIDALGRGGAFFFYAAICVVTFIFCKRLVPETKGKQLEEITGFFEQRVAHQPA